MKKKYHWLKFVMIELIIIYKFYGQILLNGAAENEVQYCVPNFSWNLTKFLVVFLQWLTHIFTSIY